MFQEFEILGWGCYVDISMDKMLYQKKLYELGFYYITYYIFWSNFVNGIHFKIKLLEIYAKKCKHTPETLSKLYSTFVCVYSVFRIS